MKDVYFTHLELTETFNIEKKMNFCPILRKGEQFSLFWEEGLSHSPVSADFHDSWFP